MSAIHFEAPLFKINSSTLLTLPKEASSKLPSRGMVIVSGTINGYSFQTPLEPDGRGSHWLKVDDKMRKAINADVGDTVKLAIEPSKEWPEPELPADLKKGLQTHPDVLAIWDDITPMARWDWIRWISSTGRSETRQRRIEVGFSKLKAGTRRPCCFNRTLCTDMSVSKNGALLEPTAV